MYVFIFIQVRVTEWLSIGKKKLLIWLTICSLLYKYMLVNLVCSHLGFYSGNFFLIAQFPDHCLLLSLCASHDAIALRYPCLV